MASFSSVGSGNWNTEGGVVWVEAGHPVAGDTVTIQNTHTVTLVQNEACASLTVDAGGTIAVGTYNLVHSGACVINGNWTGDTSSDAGITCTSFTLGASSVGTFVNAGTKIQVAGNITIASTAIYTSRKIYLYSTASGNINATSGYLYQRIYVNAGSTLTVSAASGNLTTNEIFDIEGTLALGSYTTAIGVELNSGTFTIGAAGDITGSAGLIWYGQDCTTVYSKSGALSFSGAVSATGGSLNVFLPSCDWSNANATIAFTASATYTTRGIGKGTAFKCKNLTFTQNNNQAVTVGHSTNNPSYAILGNLDVTGTYANLISYTKGTGTITLTDGSGNTFNFNGWAVEDLIINSVGITKTLTNHVTVDTLSIVAGTFNQSTYNCTSVGASSLAGTHIIGVSSDTGFTTAGFTQTTGGRLNMQTTSKFNNSGNFTGAIEVWFTTKYTGIYKQTGNGTYTGQQNDNIWWKFDINNCTMTTGTGSNYITGFANYEFTMTGNAVLAIPAGRSMQIGAGNAGGNNVTIGVDCDITGAGTLTLIPKTTNFVNNRATAFSFTGTVDSVLFPASTTIPGWDFSNANVIIRSPSVISYTKTICAGTLKCKDFTTISTVAYQFKNDTYNPSFVVSGTWTIDSLCTWVKGTGTITFSQTTGTPTMTVVNGTVLEDIIVSNSGVTSFKLIGNCTTDTFTLSAGAFDIQSYDFTSVGASSCAGTLTIGASGGTGFTTVGFTQTGIGVLTTDLTGNSKINNSGNWTTTGAWKTSSYTGTYTQTGNGTYTGVVNSGTWYSFTVSNSVLTCGAGINFLTGISSKEFVLSGTGSLVIGAGNSFILGASSGITGHNVTVGSSCDITGSGNLLFYGTSANYVNNRAAAFSFTGTASLRSIGINALTFPAWDFSNANVNILGSTTASHTRIIIIGILRCINFTTTADIGGSFTIPCNTYNPSFIISGNIAIDVNTIWTRGTGYIRLTGSTAQSITTNSQRLGIFIVDKTGNTATLQDNLQCASVIKRRGAFDENGKTITSDNALVAEKTTSFLITMNSVFNEGIFVCTGNMDDRRTIQTTGKIVGTERSKISINDNTNSSCWFATMQDIDCSSGQTLTDYFGIDDGNNLNISFSKVLPIYDREFTEYLTAR